MRAIEPSRIERKRERERERETTCARAPARRIRVELTREETAGANDHRHAVVIVGQSTAIGLIGSPAASHFPGATEAPRSGTRSRSASRGDSADPGKRKRRALAPPRPSRRAPPSLLFFVPTRASFRVSTLRAPAPRPAAATVV